MLVGRMLRGLVRQRPIVCIGHSHIETVVAAAEAAGVALESFNFWQVPDATVHEDGATRLHPAIRTRMIAPVFSFVGGAVHQDMGFVVPHRPYDFVWPERPDLPLDETAEIVPYDGVLASMRRRVQPYLDIMADVRIATRGSMYHMQSPPIYANEQVPVNAPDWIAFFGPGRRIAPAWHRYKLWRMHSELIRDFCEQSGIIFVPCPGAALTEDGFLVEGFNGTPAHANSTYGALVLDQMLRLAGRL